MSLVSLKFEFIPSNLSHNSPSLPFTIVEYHCCSFVKYYCCVTNKAPKAPAHLLVTLLLNKMLILTHYENGN